MLFQLFFLKKRFISFNFICYLKNSTYFCTEYVAWRKGRIMLN